MCEFNSNWKRSCTRFTLSSAGLYCALFKAGKLLSLHSKKPGQGRISATFFPFEFHQHILSYLLPAYSLCDTFYPAPPSNHWTNPTPPPQTPNYPTLPPPDHHPLLMTRSSAAAAASDTASWEANYPAMLASPEASTFILPLSLNSPQSISIETLWDILYLSLTRHRSHPSRRTKTARHSKRKMKKKE